MVHYFLLLPLNWQSFYYFYQLVCVVSQGTGPDDDFIVVIYQLLQKLYDQGSEANVYKELVIGEGGVNMVQVVWVHTCQQ